MKKIIGRKEKEGKNVGFRVKYPNGEIEERTLKFMIYNIENGFEYYTIDDTLVIIEGEGNDKYLTTSPNDGGLDNINNLPTYD